MKDKRVQIGGAEIDQLLQEGLISEEQAKTMLSRCEETKVKSWGSMIFITLGTFGLIQSGYCL